MRKIRKANSTDAEQLSALAEKTFRDTFGSANSPENMDAHCKATYSTPIQLAELSDPARVTLLAEVDGAPVAFAQLRWGRAPGCVRADSPGEIQRLYVARQWHGKGIAQELMAASVEEFRGRAADVIWLGVWERNPRAIAFYKKFGFVAVGEQVFRLADDPQRDIVMARALIQGPARP